MKKVLSLVLALMLVLSMASFVNAEDDKPFIGILAPATTHGWVGGVAYFAQQAADSLDIEYRFLTSDNAEQMSAQIEELITLGVDAIVVWPQFTGVETAAEKALEKGIKIYNVDCWWWLRCPGQNKKCAGGITRYGWFDRDGGAPVNSREKGVRPAIWVSLQ